MKAFVTGANGFLGSHLVDALIKEGHEVTCSIRSTSNKRWLLNKPVRLVEGEVIPKDADWFFHVAGLISTIKPQEYYQVNAEGTRKCLEACLKFAPNLKRFVLVSSIAAAGPSLGGKKIDESDAPHPLTDYGKSKLEAEKIALQFKDRLPISIIRPPAIYGPRDEMIFPIFKLAKKGYFFVPSAKNIFITMAYVEDVAHACLWAAQSKNAVGEIFFIADGDCYRWHDVADALGISFYRKVFKIPLYKSLLWPFAFLEEKNSRLFHKRPRFHRGHLKQFFHSWCYSTDKIRKAGYVPKFNLDLGMKAAVAGYRSLGWL